MVQKVAWYPLSVMRAVSMATHTELQMTGEYSAHDYSTHSSMHQTAVVTSLQAVKSEQATQCFMDCNDPWHEGDMSVST